MALRPKTAALRHKEMLAWSLEDQDTAIYNTKAQTSAEM